MLDSAHLAKQEMEMASYIVKGQKIRKGRRCPHLPIDRIDTAVTMLLFHNAGLFEIHPRWITI